MKYSIQLFLRDQVNATIASEFTDLQQIEKQCELIAKDIESSKKKNKMVFLNNMYFNPDNIQFIRVIEQQEQKISESEAVNV